MPANLPPQYSKAEEEYRRATAPADRLEALREMFRLLPKHKGTEKLQAELKQKISRARDDLEHGKTAGAKRSGLSYRIPHEGAGQIVLIGPPNAGKSALLAALTHASPEVAPYPFTTRAPQPGMMPYLDVMVQLVDLPPITADFLEPWACNIIRGADAALLVADLADDDLCEAIEAVTSRLSEVHVGLVRELPFDNDDEARIDLKCLLVANKADTPGADDRLAILREWFGDRWDILPVSATTGAGLDGLRRSAYDLLGVVRIYTKVPGKPADRAHPFTLPAGGTVRDLSRLVHRDLEHTLKFAKVWGTGVFDGQTVTRDHELHDADVVELHT